MTQKQLQDSKISKVLKKILTLKEGDIPADEEEKYQFKPRSEKLIAKWQEIVNAGSGGAGDSAAEADGDMTTAPEVKEDAEKKEAPNGTAAAPEPTAPAAPAAAAAEETPAS